MSTYEGTEELEVMTAAVRYNAFLADSVADALRGCSKVLDFGAGIGSFATEVSQRGLHVECLEPDKAQAARVREAGFKTYEALDASAGPYDGVYTLNVLEHIEDDIGALRTLRSRMTSGARLFAYVPAFEFLYSGMDKRVGHVRRYTRASLERAVTLAGFSEVESRYVDSLGWAAAATFRFVGRSDGKISSAQVKLYDSVLFPVSRVLDRVAGRAFGKNVLLTARVG